MSDEIRPAGPPAGSPAGPEVATQPVDPAEDTEGAPALPEDVGWPGPGDPCA